MTIEKYEDLGEMQDALNTLIKEYGETSAQFGAKFGALCARAMESEKHGTVDEQGITITLEAAIARMKSFEENFVREADAKVDEWMQANPDAAKRGVH